MKTVRSEILGFCAGVRRAVKCAEQAIDENDGGQVYTFGPLIHNPVALRKFEEKNLRILSEEKISDAKKCDTVVIRAHGVPPEIYEKLEKTGAKIVNATCPLVQASQKRASEYAGKGYTIVFAGDKNHGEVIGIEGAARKAASDDSFKFLLVKTVAEAMEECSVIGKDEKIVLMSQTTFSITEFAKIEKSLSEMFPNLQVVNSICPATHERQTALEKLCAKVDGVLVIGGRTSANTNRLFVTAQKLCKKAALIENKDEIPDDFFALGTVGITAGASTPDDVIEEVERLLCKGYNK